MSALDTLPAAAPGDVLVERLAHGDLDRKQELGQFLTPDPIASFMASLFASDPVEVRLLDAGAGAGALTAALVRRVCGEKRRPRRISVTAFEVDSAILPALRRTLGQCAHECHARGIAFASEIREVDFIEAAVPLGRGDLFGSAQTPFNLTILNPPYRKISSESRTRRLLREAGIETSNLYTGFLALATRLLAPGGELVAICPRSFCNGPYFRPFREQFLNLMSLRRIHVFDSRSAAFERDAVLQENIIVYAVKSAEKPTSVMISRSAGEPGGATTERTCPYHQVVSPNDSESFIHLVTDEADEAVREKIKRFKTPLAQLGLDVSTGRVVDFRAKGFLAAGPGADTVPLIYPCHLRDGRIEWPKLGGRKPNAISDTAETRDLLVPGAIYVLVKRFTSKEERRRVVACVFDPERVRAERVGFENHLNYFHAGGLGLPMPLARGLAAYLNSTLVDAYFRQFNGHTQVNATDLRNLRYPNRGELEALGNRIGESPLRQAETDALVELRTE